jgi:hypothetical protein
MAVVVIVILIGFIGGSALTYMLDPRRAMGRETVAYFGDDEEITQYDLAAARQELEILQMLRTEDVLRSLDMGGILLGELLFSEGRPSPMLINHLKRTIRTNRYRINELQIADFYKRSVPGAVYWLLLNNEARRAGIRVPNEDAGRQLARIIPQLFEGTTYRRFISSLINRRGISQERILTAFGKLLAVWQYAHLVTSGQAVTTPQLEHLISWEKETINTEFVRFESDVFAENQEQPPEDKLREHFEKYNKSFADDIRQDNPYGFGYKLPDRVRLEYIVVKLEDVSSIVPAPTHEEAEGYYQRHTEEFTESVPSDPNDPNSPMVERTKSYAEVAGEVQQRIKQDRINSKAESILREARSLTDIDSSRVENEAQELSIEQLRELSGPYEPAAQQLSDQYKMPVYQGQTGSLSAADMQQDQYLARLYVTGYGYNPVSLIRMAFSIDEFGFQSLELLSVDPPEFYENIGPVKDFAGEIMALVRITKAEKAAPPESIDQTFSKSTITLEQPEEDPNNEEVYSVREKVTQDLKRLAAMSTTENKTNEFIALAQDSDWDTALNKFNEIYTQANEETDPNQTQPDQSEPNAFTVENLMGLRRIPKKTLQTMIMQSKDNPAGRVFVQEVRQWLTVDELRIQSRFIDKLYSLVPPDSNTVDTLPVAMEFKPDLSFYVIKDITVDRVTQDQYVETKAMQAYQETHIQSQSLTAAHFNPENILKRLNFRPAAETKEAKDTNVPAKTEDSAI